MLLLSFLSKFSPSYDRLRIGSSCCRPDQARVTSSLATLYYDHFPCKMHAREPCFKCQSLFSWGIFLMKLDHDVLYTHTFDSWQNICYHLLLSWNAKSSFRPQLAAQSRPMGTRHEQAHDMVVYIRRRRRLRKNVTSCHFVKFKLQRHYERSR